MKSAKKIAEYLNVDIQQARQARGLIQGVINPDIFDSVHNWCRQCYNEPPQHEKIMCALNEVVSGFGVEGYNYGDNDHFDYINMGDTYLPTIIYNGYRYLFSCWGDYVNVLEWREQQCQ